MHRFLLRIKLPFGELGAFFVRSSEISDILGGKVKVEPGNEDGRAEDLRKTGSMMR